MAVAWDILANAGNRGNAGDAFAQSFEKGLYQNAVRAAVSGPGNPKALAYVYSVNPQAGAALEDQLRQRSERQRADTFRTAEGNILVGSGQNAAMPPGGQGAGQAIPAPVNNALGMGPQQAPNGMTHGSTALPPPPGEQHAFTGIVGSQGPAPATQGPADGSRAAPGSLGGMGQAPGQVQAPSDVEQAMRADPEAYLKFQGQRIAVTKDQFALQMKLHDFQMQLLGGVHDDATLQAAKAQARQVYQSYNVDASFIDQIPDQYSPELVRDLQMQGMDSSKQLAAIARENRLDAYAGNIEADNERADRLADSTITDRTQRRELAKQRFEAAKGKGRTAALAKPPQTENALFTDIQRRFDAGEPVTDRERQFAHDYQHRHGGREPLPRGAKGGSSSGSGAIIKNPQTGERMQLQDGKWVPIK